MPDYGQYVSRIAQIAQVERQSPLDIGRYLPIQIIGDVAHDVPFSESEIGGQPGVRFGLSESEVKAIEGGSWGDSAGGVREPDSKE